MASSDELSPEERLIHDIKNCLHVINMGIVALRAAREDEQHFAKICDSIHVERKRASALVDKIRDLPGVRQADSD